MTRWGLGLSVVALVAWPAVGALGQADQASQVFNAPPDRVLGVARSVLFPHADAAGDSRTAPYMHNGIFTTLEEVIAFVDRGGGEGNPSLKPLGLTEVERQALRAFLVEALTGPEIEAGSPQTP